MDRHEVWVGKAAVGSHLLLTHAADCRAQGLCCCKAERVLHCLHRWCRCQLTRLPLLLRVRRCRRHALCARTAGQSAHPGIQARLGCPASCLLWAACAAEQGQNRAGVSACMQVYTLQLQRLAFHDPVAGAVTPCTLIRHTATRATASLPRQDSMGVYADGCAVCLGLALMVLPAAADGRRWVLHVCQSMLQHAPQFSPLAGGEH